MALVGSKAYQNALGDWRFITKPGIIDILHHVTLHRLGSDTISLVIDYIEPIRITSEMIVAKRIQGWFRRHPIPLMG